MIDERIHRQKWHDEDEKLYHLPGKSMGLASLTDTAAINPYSLYALGKDISHYDDLTVTDPRLVGVDFLIVKMGGSENNPRTPMGNPYIDDKFNRYVQLAYDLPNPQGGFGVPLIVYWMDGVRVYPDIGAVERNVHEYTEENHPVLSLMLQAWHAGAAWKQIKELFFDYEEPCYWMDAPYKIEEYWVKLFHEDLRDRFLHKMRNNPVGEKFPFPEIKLGLYSRRSFMDAHANSPYSMQIWLAQHPELSTWAANYPRRIPNTASVAEVRKSWLPLESWKPYSLREDGSWDYWQFAGDPDWNLYHGTPQELYKRLDYTPRDIAIEPPPPPPPAPVKKYFATVRQAAVGLKLRRSKQVGITTNIIDTDFRPTAQIPLKGAPVTEGSVTWAEMDYAGKSAFFGVKQDKNDPYADVVEKTV